MSYSAFFSILSVLFRDFRATHTGRKNITISLEEHWIALDEVQQDAFAGSQNDEKFLKSF